jgi:hypothetical protein
MKKFIFSALAVLALSCGFVSCGSDDGDPSYSHNGTPGQETAGTYSGTFTRTNGAEVTTAQGTITLATNANSGNYTDVTFTCADFSLAKQSIEKISFAYEGFVFENSNTGNGLGSKFQGRSQNGKDLKVVFTLSQKVGRKLIEFSYSFDGAKQ